MFKKVYGFYQKHQFLKYFMVGGIATAVDWGTFYIFGVKLGFYYQLALVISFTLGSVTNYTLNKVFTFQNKSKKIAQQLGVHLGISAVSLLFNMFLMYVAVDIFSVSKMIGRIVTTIIMLIINFFLHKNITFNERFFNGEK